MTPTQPYGVYLTMPKGVPRTDLATRFWSKVARGGPDACWQWTALGRNGAYGGFGLLGQGKVGAHRVAWELTHGETLTRGDVIMHTCDNPLCCNPAHLRKGTNYENNLDKLRKGRYSNGPRRGSLTEEQVAEIRQRFAQGESTMALADAFGVGQYAILNIRTGKSWHHVAGPVDTHVRYRFTEAQVIEIRERYAQGETALALAKAFGVSGSTIDRIRRGQMWTHVAGPIDLHVRAHVRKDR